MSNEKKIRADCKDVWNAFMVRGAKFPQNGIGIPFCPTTAREIPQALTPTLKREQFTIGG